MSQLTNDKNLNLAATLVPSSTARGRAPLTGALALAAALTLALFSGRAEAGMKVHNGLSGHNGMKVHNGLSGHNGMKVHNGLSGHNGMKVYNGLSGHNGMKVYNGLSGHNGMKVHNGVTVSGTWLVRTINPARPLSAAVRARR